jgi:hypothetical protein
MAQLRTAHTKAVECHTLALPHMDPPGERALVLPALFHVVPGSVLCDLHPGGAEELVVNALQLDRAGRAPARLPALSSAGIPR